MIDKNFNLLNDISYFTKSALSFFNEIDKIEDIDSFLLSLYSWSGVKTACDLK